MKFKTNLVIGVIFALLSAFVYFHEIKGGQERREAAERSKRLLDFKESEVNRLVLVRPEEQIEIERNGTAWRLLAPVEDGADGQAVERYVRNVAESEREKVVADSAEAGSADVAARYGLDQPRLKVILQTESGLLDTLSFGADAPTDRFTYVQKSGSNPEIFVVRAWRFDNLDKDVFDLRDRSVLTFGKNDVIGATRSGRDVAGLSLSREGAEWTLVEPVAARAEQSAIDGLFTKIETSEIVAFVDEAPKEDDLVEYGLADRSSIEWSLLIGAERVEKRLAIGRDDGEGRYFARDASRPQVFLVDSTLVQRLAQNVDALREKNPLHIDRESIDRIEFERGGSLVFSANRDTSGTWRLDHPVGEEAKSWKLNALLTDLQSIEAVGYAATQGGPGQLVVRLQGGESSAHEVRFHLRDGEIYLEQSDDRSAYRIDPDAFADIDLDFEDVRQKPTQSDSTSIDG